MEGRVILNKNKLQRTIDRLCLQLIEIHRDFSNTALIGIQPRGIHFSKRLHQHLKTLTGIDVAYGLIDPTLYRDDLRSKGKKPTPHQTSIPFSTEGMNVVLVDDVLYSGRTVRAALDALLDFGRPAKVELLVLIDRRFSRQLPIQPDYVGRVVDSLASERVRVEWQGVDQEDQVCILPAIS